MVLYDQNNRLDILETNSD